MPRIYVDRESTAEERAALTVGALRKLLEGMPDDAPIFPTWANDDAMPSDHEPGVEIHGFSVDGESLAVLVSLFYLDDDPR